MSCGSGRAYQRKSINRGSQRGGHVVCYKHVIIAWNMTGNI